MICPRCGKYNPDTKSVCEYCDFELEKHQKTGEGFYNSPTWKKEYKKEDKAMMGAILFWLLGVLGLIIGLIKYSGEDRVSFLVGWFRFFIFKFFILLIIGLTIYFYFWAEITNFRSVVVIFGIIIASILSISAIVFICK